MRIAHVLLLLAACGSSPEPAVTDASSGDSTSADAPAQPDATQALCARSGLVFCEDFESLPIGPATSNAWTTESANGQLAIDGTHARGQHALQVTTTGNGRARLQKTGL